MSEVMQLVMLKTTCGNTHTWYAINEIIKNIQKFCFI